MDSVATAVFEVVAEVSGMEEVTPPARLVEDLGLDSLGLVEVGVYLDERLGTDCQDRMGEVSTVRELTEMYRTAKLG